jgi:hypothetical protein
MLLEAAGGFQLLVGGRSLEEIVSDGCLHGERLAGGDIDLGDGVERREGLEGFELRGST